MDWDRRILSNRGVLIKLEVGSELMFHTLIIDILRREVVQRRSYPKRSRLCDGPSGSFGRKLFGELQDREAETLLSCNQCFSVRVGRRKSGQDMLAR